MTPDLLKRIFAETGPDFSAEICQKATMADLDIQAIDNFRRRWIRKSENPALENLSAEQLLTDAELILDGDISYAALILFGSHQALGKHLGQAEVIFEYRSSEASIPCQQREECRLGFFLFMDDIWNKVNLRNEMQHFEDGLFIWDIPTFNEVVVREVILNAVAHRDYRLPGSVFLKERNYLQFHKYRTLLFLYLIEIHLSQNPNMKPARLKKETCSLLSTYNIFCCYPEGIDR